MKKAFSIFLSALLMIGTLGVVMGAPSRGRVRGVVQDLNLEQRTFTLKSENNSLKVHVTDETVFIHEGEKSEFKQLANDLLVIVSGQIAEDKQSMTAQVVAWGKASENPDPGPGRGGPPVVKGIMGKLNHETMTFELKHQDPEGKERVLTVNYTEKTRFIRDMKPAKPSEFSNGEEVHVVGPINPEEMKMEAHLVTFGKMERPGDPGPGKPGPGGPPVPVDGIRGIVTAINHQEMIIDIKINEEVTLKVQYFEWTGFIRGNRFVFPEDLTTDVRVVLYGPVHRENKTARAHYIVW
jgi:hypothetical protein